MLAIRSDPELASLFSDAAFCGAGVLPTAAHNPANQKKGKKIVECESDEDDE